MDPVWYGGLFNGAVHRTVAVRDSDRLACIRFHHSPPQLNKAGHSIQCLAL